MVVMRLEVSDEVMQKGVKELFETNEGKLLVSSIFPGMTLSFPRKEDDIWVIEGMVDDSIVPPESQDIVAVICMKEEPASKYSYDFRKEI